MALRIIFYAGLLAVAYASFLEVDYPNVNVSAENRGDAIFEAGAGGSVYLEPGAGGTVYINHTDLRKFIEKVKSLPPIWTRTSQHGSLGTFVSGEFVSVNVEAVDPDGSNIIYSVISGHLPPGTSLNMTSGDIMGKAPDVDAKYSFGIRATDNHGKYADGTFSISIRESDQCLNNPCQNGGTCRDDLGTFNCTCAAGFGGDRCQTDCVMHAFGVASNVKSIPDAMMSGHLTFSTYNPWDGRLKSSTGWVGNDTGSWLQVDLGSVHDVVGIAHQGYNSANYYISSFKVSTSDDGNTFGYVTVQQSQIIKGDSNYATIIKSLFDSAVKARFIRFLPITWHNGGHPGMRVEVFGC